MDLDLIVLEQAIEQTRQENLSSALLPNLKKRSLRAIDKAAGRLIAKLSVDYSFGKLRLESKPAETDADAKVYETTHTECRRVSPDNCLCPAFWDGYPCWHRAALEIIENYLSICEQLIYERSGQAVHDRNTTVASVYSLAAINRP